MKRSVWTIIVVLVVSILCSGCTLFDYQLDKNLKRSDAEKQKDYLKVQAACEEAFGDDFDTIEIKSWSYYEDKYIRLHVLLNRASCDAYYGLEDGLVRTYHNYAAVEKQLIPFFMERTGLPAPVSGGLRISAMESGKRLLCYGDKTIDDVVRNGHGYQIQGELVYQDETLFQADTLDRIFKVFDRVDISIYIRHAIPVDRTGLFSGEPTIRYTKNDEGQSVLKRGREMTKQNNIVSEGVGDE